MVTVTLRFDNDKGYLDSAGRTWKTGESATLEQALDAGVLPAGAARIGEANGPAIVPDDPQGLPYSDYYGLYYYKMSDKKWGYLLARKEGIDTGFGIDGTSAETVTYYLDNASGNGIAGTPADIVTINEGIAERVDSPGFGQVAPPAQNLPGNASLAGLLLFLLATGFIVWHFRAEIKGLFRDLMEML